MKLHHILSMIIATVLIMITSHIYAMGAPEVYSYELSAGVSDDSDAPPARLRDIVLSTDRTADDPFAGARAEASQRISSNLKISVTNMGTRTLYCAVGAHNMSVHVKHCALPPDSICTIPLDDEQRTLLARGELYLQVIDPPLSRTIRKIHFP